MRVYKGRKELSVVHIGIQVGAFMDPETLRPDPGWTHNEVERIRSVGDSAVRVLVSHRWRPGPEENFLLELTAQAEAEDVWFQRAPCWCAIGCPEAHP